MALPASGQISFNDINVELGVAGTTQASLGQTSYRNLAGVASGAISMSNFYGKSNAFSFTISANTANANLRTLAVAAGWNQSSKVVATINSGIYVYSTSTGTPAMTVNGSFPGGVEIVNNGIIIGRGGNGGNGAYSSPVNGYGGGVALSVSVPLSITNNSSIGGGGGGGGGGGAVRSVNYNYYYFSTDVSYSQGPGGGGGRGGSVGGYLSGNAGTLAAPGSGRSAGSNPVTTSGSGGAIGSSGANGYFGYGGGYGGAAGACTSGNSNITWLVTGNRYGALN